MAKRHGAYGFSFSGVSGPLLREFPQEWPTISISQTHVGAQDAIRRLTDHQAQFPLLDDGSVEIERDPDRAIYRVTDPLSDEEIAHPYLVPAAAVHAHWRGRETFHAGGFVAQGRAWAVAAGRRGGKSSFLAALAMAGLPIVSDDLFVVDRDIVFSGPRSVDLRPDAVGRFPGSRNIGFAGNRARWRLDPGPVAPENPFGGWFLLEWRDDLGAELVAPRERIRQLASRRSVKAPPTDPALMLGLCAYPMWRISRPREWSTMDEAIRLVTNLSS